MKVLLATCPVCGTDQEAEVVSDCVLCTIPHADVKCIHCGCRFSEFNPAIYEKP